MISTMLLFPSSPTSLFFLSLCEFLFLYLLSKSLSYPELYLQYLIFPLYTLRWASESLSMASLSPHPGTQASGCLVPTETSTQYIPNWVHHVPLPSLAKAQSTPFKKSTHPYLPICPNLKAGNHSRLFLLPHPLPMINHHMWVRLASKCLRSLL